jgi:hypothetical protein
VQPGAGRGEPSSLASRQCYHRLGIRPGLAARSGVLLVALTTLLIGCTHTVDNCSHVNDLTAIPRPASIELLTPLGHSGEALGSGDVHLAAEQPGSRDLTVVWRACNILDQLSVAETASTVSVTVEVSGCPPLPGGVVGPPPSGDVWFGGTVRLTRPIGGREVVDATPVFCDTVIH